MPKDKPPSEAASDQGHTPAFVTEPERTVPRCVKCGIEQPVCRYLHTVCDACAEARLAADEAAIQANKGRAFAPYTRHQRERQPSGMPPIAEILIPTAIEARRKLKLLSDDAAQTAQPDDEVPW